MVEFSVRGMTCGGCARAVTEAIQAVDIDAVVNVDLAGSRVSVGSSADPERLRRAIEEAGYEAKRQAA